MIQKPELYTRRDELNQFFIKLRRMPKEKYTLYLNFDENTWPERAYVKKLFREKNYCFISKAAVSFEKYLAEMAQSKFTLSPRGEGPDCYRTWESLLVGSIPIVKKSALNVLYEGLPVLLIDEWEEISEEFLAIKYKEITSKKYDLCKLYVEYWLAQITLVRDQFLATLD